MVSGEYDMDKEEAMSGLRQVLSYAVTTTAPELKLEERTLQPEEDQIRFPEVDIHQGREEARTLMWSILKLKLEEALTLGCCPYFLSELAQILSGHRFFHRRLVPQCAYTLIMSKGDELLSK
ncbi:hypothetical protein GQ600_22416 [Phytophthora cactorum]|nr:hypothetical protein GQ600_22416 [Phytophthora cactorum]